MESTRLTRLFLRSAAALAFISGAALAQDFTMSRATVAGGAAIVSGGNLSLAGTTGQALVGSSSGGVFDTSGGVWSHPPAFPGCSPADVTEPFGVLNFFDISAFIALYNAGDPAADLAAPVGTLNFFDISVFISLYNAGCP